MKEKPTPFSRLMVQAILDGRKTMTRRIVMPQPTPSHLGADYLSWQRNPKWMPVHCPKQDFTRLYAPYHTGDTLWVKEEYYEYGRWVNDGKTEAGKDKLRFEPTENRYSCPIYYPDTLPSTVEANKKRKPGVWDYYWRNPRFMPRYAARLFLDITNVKTEQLQDISEEDALAEGADQPLYSKDGHMIQTSPRDSFSWIWDGLNEKRGYGWDTNPYVFAIKFTPRKNF